MKINFIIIIFFKKNIWFCHQPSCPDTVGFFSPCQKHWSAFVVKGSTSDITFALGCPVGSPFMSPLVAHQLKVVPICLFMVTRFGTAGSAGVGASDENLPYHTAATRSPAWTCQLSWQVSWPCEPPCSCSMDELISWSWLC